MKVKEEKEKEKEKDMDKEGIERNEGLSTKGTERDNERDRGVEKEKENVGKNEKEEKKENTIEKKGEKREKKRSDRLYSRAEREQADRDLLFVQSHRVLVGGFSGTVGELCVLDGIPEEALMALCVKNGPGQKDALAVLYSADPPGPSPFETTPSNITKMDGKDNRDNNNNNNNNNNNVVYGNMSHSVHRHLHQNLPNMPSNQSLLLSQLHVHNMNMTMNMNGMVQNQQGQVPLHHHNHPHHIHHRLIYIFCLIHSSIAWLHPHHHWCKSIIA